MQLKDFFKKAIDHHFDIDSEDLIEQYIADGDITDRFFCYLQCNRELLGDYLNTVAETGDVKVVNSHIAQYLCDKYKLQSGEMNHYPYSYLIQGYHFLRRNS